MTFTKRQMTFTKHQMTFIKRQKTFIKRQMSDQAFKPKTRLMSLKSLARNVVFVAKMYDMCNKVSARCISICLRSIMFLVSKIRDHDR